MLKINLSTPPRRSRLMRWSDEGGPSLYEGYVTNTGAWTDEAVDCCRYPHIYIHHLHQHSSCMENVKRRRRDDHK
ncbi:hypothetical protein [Oryza sativa Japonica Group]|uniref:Uncharacterized protein n=1 Tax=Oryza sativa subsp. japonica TaxID=39947 RepID=Q655Q8_ORYSJ|nr:hypothetical protein [Oryza sativa Japonica Group]